MIKNIIFDFDGVILDSVPVKTEGFRVLFKDYPQDMVEKMIHYHLHNGGISRYKKIRYFFNELLLKDISENDVLNFANKYSDITKEELTKTKYIIEDTVNFVRQNYKKYNMHIASGADHLDLTFICDKLGLTQYFQTIDGSPMIKSEIVANILKSHGYNKKETILIGDSINDYEAAKLNDIEFYGYNNLELRKSYKYFIQLNGICMEKV